MSQPGEPPARPLLEDQVVWTVVWLLGLVQLVQTYLLYRQPARKWFGYPDNPNPYFNWLYGGVRLVILVGLVFLQAACSAPLVTILIAALALWCAAVIIVWYVKLLLDRAHDLLSAERNLLFLILNSAEVVLALALLLALGGGTMPSAVLDALSALTLNGVVYGGGWAATAEVLGTVAGLALLAAGLALLIGLIQERFFEGGAATKIAPYEGASRPPKPPWLGGTSDFTERIPLM
jgi:hypothetical protein